MEAANKLEQLHRFAGRLTADATLRDELVRGLANQLIEPTSEGLSAPAEARLDGATYLTPYLQAALTGRQYEVWQHLIAGNGIRQTGRALGISHVAVLKHRRRIAATARAVLAVTNGPRLPSPPAPESAFAEEYDALLQQTI